MKPFLSQTVAEQVAAYLRREVDGGELSGVMPGVLKLEAATGVNRKTVEAALQILERDGVLRAQGVKAGVISLPLWLAFQMMK